MKSTSVIVWGLGLLVATCVLLNFTTWWRLVLGVPRLRMVAGMYFGDALAILRGVSAFDGVEFVVVRARRANSTEDSVTTTRGSTVALFVDDDGIVKNAEFVVGGTRIKHDGIVVTD